MRGVRPCGVRGEQEAAISDRQTRSTRDPMTIPRHVLPGRIVLTIGLVTSSLCVVALIILWLG